MEDYRWKLEKLPTTRLRDLADRYRETIARLEVNLREARAAGMEQVAEYTGLELTKKKQDLTDVEQILAGRQD